MTISEYQKWVLEHSAIDIYKYCVYGLCEEAGELAGKFKRYYRDRVWNIEDVQKEMGDVLFYLAAIANSNGIQLTDVIQLNVEKVLRREQNGTVSGSGDDR